MSGDDIDGGSDTVQIISTSGPPITISYEESAYTFAEEATDEAIYVLATLDAAYPRGPGPSISVPHRLFVAERYGGQPRRLRRDNLESEFPSQRFRA